MALDISESAVYSWLRHVKGYSIVHNNWKLTPTHIDEYAQDEYVNSIIDTFNDVWKEHYQKELFGKAQQTLRQAECDAVGIKTDKCRRLSIAVIEVACHIDGLLYKDKCYTGDKVVSKTVLDIVMSYLCFGNTNLEVCFVSPVVTPSVKAEVDERVRLANDLLKNSLHMDVGIKTIFNEDFKNQIHNPLLELVKHKKIKSTEDSEDYLRSLMIYTL